MSKVVPQDRPTFKIAHWYRCQGLCERQNFLEFEKTFVEMVETIANAESDTELWKYVRSLFAFDDYADCVPINAANLSVLFNPVQTLMNSLALDWNRDISIQKREEPFVYTIQAARELVASELNVQAQYLAFQRNGSDPNAVINNGLDFSTGEEVVVWNENHPTNGDVAWKIRKNRFPNINIVIVDLKGEKDPQKIIDVFVNAVNEKTKIVCVSEVKYFS